jgi:hypothetical protein
MINFQNNTNLHPKLDTKQTILTITARNTKQLFFESRFLYVGIWVHGVLISSVQWLALPCTNGVFGGRLNVLGVFTLEPFFGFV